MAPSDADSLTVAVLTGPDEGLPPGLEPLHERARVRHAWDRQSLSSALPEADVLMVTDFRTTLLQELWPRAQRVQWVHATSAGVDALMFDELVASEVPVTNARGIFDAAISEFVLGQILIFAKDFAASFALQRQHCWQHRETETLAGREVVVVGAGSIGRHIARQLSAAGMRVTGVARSARGDDPDFAEVRASDELTGLLSGADFVVVAAPLTEGTRGLFGPEAFRRMPPHSRLINIGRGPIVQTGALVSALKSGEIAGAALDVFETEPLPADHPLWDMPQVILSAHMAGDFIGWQTALTEQFLENFERWRAGRELFNLVDKRRGYAASS